MQNIYLRPQWVFYFVHFRGASGRGGAKIEKLFEKVKAFLQIKIICTKFVLKCDIYIIQLQLKNINSLKSH